MAVRRFRFERRGSTHFKQSPLQKVIQGNALFNYATKAVII